MSELLKRIATQFAMVVAVLVTACSTETPDPTLNYIVNSGSSTTADADTDVDADTDTDTGPTVDTDTGEPVEDTGEYQVTSWFDHDGDGYGDPTVSVTASSMPAGFVANGMDCDDDVATVNPDAMEVCDTVDNDCDGMVDDNAIDAATWVRDADLDGYGDAALSGFATSCSQPVGYAGNATDCDDANTLVNPGAEESDNDVDDDCNGSVDDVGNWCCMDGDGDGWGSDGDEDGDGVIDDGAVACTYSSSGTCIDPYVVGDGDCDDSNGSVSPAQTIDLAGDGEDDDCDGDPDA